MSKLAELITAKSPLLLDGAMGTQLALAGLEMGGQNCVSNPEEVRAVHKRYVDVGCDLIISNTLTMNRISLESHKSDIDVKEVNIAGAQIAKSVVSVGQFVLGDISSTGQLLEPYGDYEEDQFYENFKEQAEYLVAGGVDGFIVETMIDAREAICAVKACRDVSDLPILATLSFQTVDKGGRTVMGNPAGESAQALVEAGAMAVGANCGDLDPHETSLIIGMMKEAVDVPLIAQPNAGKPRLENFETIFDITTQDFVSGISDCIEAGASLVGGCCGTSPKLIGSVAMMMGKQQQQ